MPISANAQLGKDVLFPYAQNVNLHRRLMCERSRDHSRRMAGMSTGREALVGAAPSSRMSGRGGDLRWRHR